VHATLLRMRGDVGVQGGYVFLQQANNDVSGARIPLAPRHATTLRVLWEPSWLGLALQAGVQVLADRVDAGGRNLGTAVVPHAGAVYLLGPLQVGCTVDNVLGVVDAPEGIRAGRSARCFVAAAP
jgi:outer membrane receptor protein involved in Fe transport